jgi:hypothetical protein
MCPAAKGRAEGDDLRLRGSVPDLIRVEADVTESLDHHLAVVALLLEEAL